MRELFERLRVPLLVVLLGALSLIVVASDRRAMARGQEERGFLPGLVLELAAPGQKVLSLPAWAPRRGSGGARLPAGARARARRAGAEGPVAAGLAHAQRLGALRRAARGAQRERAA